MPRVPNPPGQGRAPVTGPPGHRPAGSPQPREARSQQSQLESERAHGNRKDVKVKMEQKNGRKPPKHDWTR
ncbi:MAG: hypothetical protein AB1445_13080 [Bacillota bacterium]